MTKFHINPGPMVRPGEGVDVEQIPVDPARQQLQEGTYDLRQLELEELPDALGNLAIAPADTPADTPARKGFRNAYASLVMDRAWPEYSEACMEEMYTIEFDTRGRSSLKPVSVRSTDMTPPEVVEALACTSELTLTHFICRQFVDGSIPAMSHDGAKNVAYFNALKRQTDLGMFAGARFNRLPKTAGSPSEFVSSGTRVLRTHIFPLATLIDELTERDGFILNNEQHRRSFLKSIRRSITPYYLPTVPVAVESSDLLIDPAASMNRLNPDAWVHSGGADDLLVYPDPAMIASANEQIGDKPLEPQTGCPVFHSRIPSSTIPGSLIPLPRSLPSVIVGQLDKWYYPVRNYVIED